MIKSIDDYKFYLKSDKFALYIKQDWKSKIKRFFFTDDIWEFEKALRKAEYFRNCRKGFLDQVLYFFAYRKYRKLSLKLGFSIPLNVFGPGLSIAHYGNIVVNSNARIGKNCRIHVGVNIGASGGEKQAPTIGNNCYIGPGVKLYGDIELGNNIAIAANATVNSSFLDNNILLGGIPAKKIKDINVDKIVLFAADAVKTNISQDVSKNIFETNQLVRESYEK